MSGKGLTIIQIDRLFPISQNTHLYQMAAISTVCFTGHRQQRLGGFEKNPTADYVKVALREAIERAVKQGVETFISGGNLGVGQWAADIVLDLKAKESKKSRGQISNIKS